MSIPDIDNLRELIENTLSSLGMPDAEWSCMDERTFCRSRRGGKLPPWEVLALWLEDRNEIEFLGKDEKLLTTVRLDPEDVELIEAA